MSAADNKKEEMVRKAEEKRKAAEQKAIDAEQKRAADMAQKKKEKSKS